MMTLKPYSFITTFEAAMWLKMKPEQCNAVGDTKASKIIQDLTYTSKAYTGVAGNQIAVEYKAGGTLGVTVSGPTLTVALGSGSPTAQDIKTLVEASYEANRLVSVAVTGAPLAVQVAEPLTNLAGGTNASGYESKYEWIVTELINNVCEKIEEIIGGPVLYRDIIGEIHDGSASNVISLDFYPIREIKSLKIDYNRDFGDNTVIDPKNYILRGTPDKRTLNGSQRIIGTDLVLRDDQGRFIAGRIFAGTVLGSIKVDYVAGWANGLADLPGGIKQAALLLIEYLYLQRENRDINVSSKGVKGESYSKLKDGIPEQIYEMLEEYQDVGFGKHPQPQKNFMPI